MLLAATAAFSRRVPPSPPPRIVGQLHGMPDSKPETLYKALHAAFQYLDYLLLVKRWQASISFVG
jgi:hypothetical protein